MAFPTPFGGVSALYPVTIGTRYPVKVLQFDDGTEQRFRESAGVVRLTLSLEGMTKTEKDAVVTFFNTSKGSFDATWSITLGASTYSYMAFASDIIDPVEQQNGMWSVTVQLVQTRKN
jgi:hypothetical protein